MDNSNDNDEEVYILLLLADGNLPTGSFVASSGLESYVTHGFAAIKSPSAVEKSQPVIEFVRDSLSTYARSVMPFVSDAHTVMGKLLSTVEAENIHMSDAILDIKSLDTLYQVMTLNHVARRASERQGVALLSLYSKGFARPVPLDTSAAEHEEIPSLWRDNLAAKFIDELKLAARKGDMCGHQPVCWGVLTAALGLSLGMTPVPTPRSLLTLLLSTGRSQFLSLFLHARGVLSAAVRLNSLGPYAAQQILLHAIHPLVREHTARCRHLRTGFKTLVRPDHHTSIDADDELNGPAMTWPLGEIIAARHDLQHSRIFNS